MNRPGLTGGASSLARLRAAAMMAHAAAIVRAPAPAAAALAAPAVTTVVRIVWRSGKQPPRRRIPVTAIVVTVGRPAVTMTAAVAIPVVLGYQLNRQLVSSLRLGWCCVCSQGVHRGGGRGGSRCHHSAQCQCRRENYGFQRFHQIESSGLLRWVTSALYEAYTDRF